jgi:hypothetical protein
MALVIIESRHFGSSPPLLMSRQAHFGHAIPLEPGLHHFLIEPYTPSSADVYSLVLINPHLCSLSETFAVCVARYRR